MKIQQILNQAETIHIGMDIQEAIKVYSIYYGLTLKYCEEAIFKGNDGKYYSIQPRAVLVELKENEVQKELSKLPSCSDSSCNGHLILSLNKSRKEELICDKCGKVKLS